MMGRERSISNAYPPPSSEYRVPSMMRQVDNREI